MCISCAYNYVIIRVCASRDRRRYYSVSWRDSIFSIPRVGQNHRQLIFSPAKMHKKTYTIRQNMVYMHNNLTLHFCYSKLKKYHIHCGLSALLIFVSKGGRVVCMLTLRLRSSLLPKCCLCFTSAGRHRSVSRAIQTLWSPEGVSGRS